MAQTIRLKRSATANSVPGVGDLALGEVAINTNDGRVFSKMDAGAPAVFEIAMLNNGSVQNFTSDVEVSSNGYFKLPVGTTAQRDSSPSAGQIRYNTSLNTFEGYSGSNWGSLGGVIDTAQTSYALAGVSGNTSLPHTGTANALTFVVNGTKVGEWSSTQLDVNTALNVDGAFTTTGDSTIGNAAADTLTVNATSTFNAPVTVADGQTFTANGDITLGNSGTDLLIVNAASVFTGASTFTEPVIMQKGFSVPAGGGTSTFNDGVTIANGQSFTFDGNAFNNAHKFTVKDASGTIVFGGWMFDTDANSAN